MIIFTEVNRNNYYTISNEKRIIFVNKYRNFIFYDYDDLYYDVHYYYYEYEKFKNYFMGYYYSYDKLESISYYNYSGKDHREDGPAYILYDNSKKIDKSYCLNGKEYSYEEYLLEIKKLV